MEVSGDFTVSTAKLILYFMKK